MDTVKCSVCGKEMDFKNARECEICGKIVCLDCLGYFAVYKRSVYRDYENLVPVCPNCKPKAMLSKKLLKIVDEVFREEKEVKQKLDVKITKIQPK